MTVANGVVTLILTAIFIEALDGLSPGQVDPKYQVLYPGTATKIRCRGSTTNLYWTKDGQVLHFEKKVVNDQVMEIILDLSDLQSVDEGRYVCVDEGSNPFTAEAEIYLAALDPTPGIVEPKYREAQIDEMVSYTCNFDGEVLWYFMTTPDLPLQPPVHYGETFSFRAEKNGGFLICLGVKDKKKYMARAFLEVKSPVEIRGEIVHYYAGDPPSEEMDTQESTRENTQEDTQAGTSEQDAVRSSSFQMAENEQQDAEQSFFQMAENEQRVAGAIKVYMSKVSFIIVGMASSFCLKKNTHFV